MKTLRFLSTILCLGLLVGCGSNPDDLARIKELEDSLRNMTNQSLLFDSGRRVTADINGESLNLIASETDIRAYAATITASGQIDSAKAAQKLLKFKIWADLADDGDYNSSIDWTKEVYGSLFTWKEFKAFVDYVRDLRQNGVKIDGIRAYQGSVFHGSSFISDIFLIPTYQKKNIIDIDPDYPSFINDFDKDSENDLLQFIKTEVAVKQLEPIFNTSFPCPNTCP